MGVMQEISEALQKGKANDVKELVQSALDGGATAKEVLEGGLMPGMDVTGRRFKANEIYVPEVLIAARAMAAGTAILKPLLISEDVQPRGTVVLGTVKGDLHDIGKNLVKMMMEGKGFNVVDLGTDVTADRFVAAATENNAQIIACSALLTTTMTQMKDIVAAADGAGIRDKVKIMVGGAPVTQQYCDSIGADAYAADAASAADQAVVFVEN
jgi:corrinoid protein of di/trimethylamine methyltransferase